MSAVRSETLDRRRPPVSRGRRAAGNASGRSRTVSRPSGRSRTVRSETTRSRAVAQSPRAARSSARPLPQESAGPRARRRVRLRWPSALSCAVAGLLLVGGTAVYVQGERITAQRTADGLAAEIDVARTEQRDLVVELARAETPGAIARGAARADLVEPAEVAPVPAAPVPAAPVPVPPGPAAPVASAPSMVPVPLSAVPGVG